MILDEEQWEEFIAYMENPTYTAKGIALIMESHRRYEKLPKRMLPY